MRDFEIVHASPDLRPAIENMLQLYTHDFSEQWADRIEGELDENGRFTGYPALDTYWHGEDRIPLVLRAKGRLAGFALLNTTSHTDRSVDRNMAEFFVARKHRRSGLGTFAAHTIFDRYPGQWEAAVARRNIGALVFWRKAVAAHPMARELEEVDVATTAWNGPVLRFRILP
jgi:predicted acetyltransferase